MSRSIDVTIEGLGAQGDGIARAGDDKLYVPLALPGEQVRVTPGGKQGDGFAARLDDILTPSADRVDPACPHFQECGGCSLQHLASEAYLEFKYESVRRSLRQRGLDESVVRQPLAFQPGTRRRVTLAARMAKQGLILGFHQKRGHHVVDIHECAIAARPIEALLPGLRALLADILPKAGKATIRMTAVDNGVDMVIDAGMSLGMELRERLAAFALDSDLARLSWKDDRDEEPVIVQRAPVVQFGGIKVALPTSVFLQASAESEQALIDYVLRHVGDAAAIADLFSGVGTFSFPLAQQAQVDAFDIDVQMVEAARKALPKGQDAPRLNSTRRDLFREPLTRAELAAYDAVVLDPPRAGAKAQCADLADAAVDTIIMVSCNPATFARDARTLVDGGFELEEVQPVDQFLWSGHIELVARFNR